MGRLVKPLRLSPPSKAKARNFIVDIASPQGGGRHVVNARSPGEARALALIVVFGTVHIPKGTDIIVTDPSKRANAQEFSGPSRRAVTLRGKPQQ